MIVSPVMACSPCEETAVRSKLKQSPRATQQMSLNKFSFTNALRGFAVQFSEAVLRPWTEDAGADGGEDSPMLATERTRERDWGLLWRGAPATVAT